MFKSSPLNSTAYLQLLPGSLPEPQASRPEMRLFSCHPCFASPDSKAATFGAQTDRTRQPTLSVSFLHMQLVTSHCPCKCTPFPALPVSFGSARSPTLEGLYLTPLYSVVLRTPHTPLIQSSTVFLLDYNFQDLLLVKSQSGI